MLVGGALVNALAFSGSNVLFSMIEELWCRRRAQASLSGSRTATGCTGRMVSKWTERLDWINEELRRQGHAVQTFRDVDAAIREYSRVTGQKIDPLEP